MQSTTDLYVRTLCDVMWIAVNTGKLAERLAVGVVAYSEPTSYKAACTVKGFVEVTVPGYSVDDFYAHFRMTRSTFEVILIWLCTGSQHVSTVWSHKIKIINCALCIHC